MKRLPLFWALMSVMLGVVLIMFMYYPVAFVLKSAFFPARHFTLQFFAIMFQNRLMMQSVVNSFALAAMVTVLSVVISMPLAWYSSRYRLAGHGLLTGFLMLPMVLPPFVGAIGMRQFLARFGTLNVVLMKAGFIAAPIDWLGSGFWGVVLLEVLHLFPIVYLNLTAALGSIDPSMEEAAWNLGSSKLRFMRKILFPLAAPGLFAGCAIVFVWSFTDLGTPLILEYRSVVSYQIFNMINDIYENPMGYALVVFVLMWVALIYFSSKYFFLNHNTHSTSRASRAVTRPALPLKQSILVIALFLIIGTAAVVPHLMVVVSSVAERWFMTALPEQLTTSYYVSIAHHSLTVSSIRNSVLLSGIATILDIVIGIGAAYVIARFRFFGRQLLDFSIMLPLALPGLILAFGYVGTFAGTLLDPRNNPFPLLVVAYGIRRLPFMVRSLDAGLRQVAPSMEEASFNLGATHRKTLMRITLPLISPHILAGAILVFAFAMLEVSDSLILAMKDTYYPMTKAIFALVNRIGDGFPMASAMGVLAMVLLGGSMLLAGKTLGRKFGELFRM